MLKNPQDRRAKRTALQIKETMLSFMEHRPIHEITVSEICKTCQINRATFYDHYRDVFDLVQDMEKDILRELETLMGSLSPDYVPDEEVSELFFSFLEKHRRAMNVLILGERSREFVQQLYQQIMPFTEQQVRRNYEIPKGADDNLKDILEFIAMGYSRFYLRILTNKTRNIRAEAELCASLSNACLRTLFRRKDMESTSPAS